MFANYVSEFLYDLPIDTNYIVVLFTCTHSFV